MKKRMLIGMLSIFCFVLCGCPSYNKIMTKKIIDAYGSDVKDFVAFSYPTDNYGLATSYTPSAGTNNLSYGDILCDMWYCLGVSDTGVPTDINEWLTLKGYASKGKGATITLSESEVRNVVVKGLLPQVYEVLNISGNIDVKKTLKTELELGPTWIRTLRKPAWTEYINNISSKAPLYLLKKEYDKGSLTIVVADVVTERMKAKISVDNNAAASIDGALGSASGKFFKSAKFGVNVKKEGQGVYSFEVSRPVILMRLAKVQPSAGALALEDTFESWSLKETPDCTEPTVNCRRP